MAAAWRRQLAWIGAGIFLAIVLYAPVREARRAARESGQRSLISQIERQLMLYHSVHDRYPDSLEGMRFTFTDGANAQTLKRIEYHTDGSYYRLVTPSDFDGSEISVCR